MKNVLFTAFFAGMALCASAQKTVFVSPTGNDAWAGDRNRPFKTLNRAFAESENSRDTLYIQVASGDYFLEKSLDLSGGLNCPVVVKGNEKNKPRFLGGIKIQQWEKCRDGVYRAFVPEVKRYGYQFEQFFVNGVRAVQARTPNKDWFYVKGSEEYPYVSGVRSANYATQKIVMDKQDLKSLSGLSADELADVRFRFYHKWDITQKEAAYACPDSGFVYFHGGGMQPWNPISKGARYIMYGYKAALDAPGEWYLDKADGYVYYMPREGENLETAECIVSTLHQWIVVKGHSGAALKDIRFENLSLQYAAYSMPKFGDEPMQAAATVEAAIELEYADNVTFANCEMQHTGGYALWFKAACTDNTIDHCYMADLGAGGIK